MANQIEVEIVAKLDGIDSSLKKLQNDAKAAGDNIGKSLGSNVEKGISASFKSIASIVAAAGAAILSGLAFNKIIDEATKSEVAINRLNQSLASAGTFSQAASLSIQAFADEIQRTTKLEDEAVLSGVALARNFARTNEEAVSLTKAAIDLSAATGVSLDTAIENLGKSLTGVAGRLAQTAPGVKQFTEDQLKAGAAIDFVAKRFAGAAAGEVNTFSGAVTQLNNIFNNFLEKIGEFIVKSPAIREAVKFISSTFVTLTEELSKLNQSGGDPLKNILISAIDVSRFFVGILGPAIEFVVGWFQKLGMVYGGIAAAMVQFMSGDFTAAVDTAKQVTEEFFNTTDLFAAKSTESVDQFLSGLKNAVASSNASVNELKNNVLITNGEMANSYAITFEFLKNQFNQFSVDAKARLEGVKNEAKTLAGYFSGAFVNGIASGFAAFGSALATGENGFAAFGKSILKTLGTLAIQIGSFFIAVGAGLTATTILFGFSGGAAIAAGIALTLLGGVLQGLAGGGGGAGAGAPSSGTSTSGGGVTTGTSSPIGDSATSFAQNEQRQAPGSNVTVNIAGSVLGDKRTLGKEIADSLNEAFGFDGIVISRGALS